MRRCGLLELIAEFLVRIFFEQLEFGNLLWRYSAYKLSRHESRVVQKAS